MGPNVPGPGALAQRRGVHAERMHGHLGDVAPVGDPPGRARARHVGAQDRRAALHERERPPLGVEPGAVRGEHPVEDGPAHLLREHPVVVRRRPRGVAEVRDAGLARRVAQPLPDHPRRQAQVVILDQHPQPAGWRPGRGLLRHGVGERLVVGQVGLPVTAELAAEPRLVRGVEEQVVQEPQGRVGHVVVGAVEGVGRDVEHPHRDSVPVAGPGVLPPRGRAVRVGQRRADPRHVGLRPEGRQAVRHPRDHAAAASPSGQRAVGAELVRNRPAVGRHQDSLLHSPAG